MSSNIVLPCLNAPNCKCDSFASNNFASNIKPSFCCSSCQDSQGRGCPRRIHCSPFSNVPPDTNINNNINTNPAVTATTTNVNNNVAYDPNINNNINNNNNNVYANYQATTTNVATSHGAYSQGQLKSQYQHLANQPINLTPSSSTSHISASTSGVYSNNNNNNNNQNNNQQQQPQQQQQYSNLQMSSSAASYQQPPNNTNNVSVVAPCGNRPGVSLCQSCGICDSYNGKPYESCSRSCKSGQRCTSRIHIYNGPAPSSSHQHHHQNQPQNNQGFGSSIVGAFSSVASGISNFFHGGDSNQPPQHQHSSHQHSHSNRNNHNQNNQNNNNNNLQMHNLGSAGIVQVQMVPQHNNNNNNQNGGGSPRGGGGKMTCALCKNRTNNPTGFCDTCTAQQLAGIQQLQQKRGKR